MSEPENFLSRWSRRKREADAAPDAEVERLPAGALASSAPAPEEPAFDLASLPSIDSIAADSDVSMFMNKGVPPALRHAALRRAWASDPAIRDFRGLQENHWDFTASDGVPGFGTFNSESEIKELAQRLFGGGRDEPEPISQSASQDNQDVPVEEAASACDASPQTDQPPLSLDTAVVPKDEDTTAAPQDDRVAVRRETARRHGGALPQ